MTLTRQMTFWVVTLVVGVAVLWVLHEILLPFVAGMVLAYLLDPLATRLELSLIHISEPTRPY